MSKRISGAVLLFVLLAVMLWLLQAAGASLFIFFPQGIDNAVKANFPAASFLRRAQVSLKYMGGNKVQNGVFISEDSLMLDVHPGSQSVINKNTLAMIDFVETFERPSYVMLIPTACAVQQNKTPYGYDQLLYNQKQLQDEVYRRVSGSVTSIDVYPVLRNHQQEYIYYRTENTLTGLGGYYVYEAAAKRLGLKVRGLDQYEVEHLDYEFYGDLYRRSPYSPVSPDRVSAYSLSQSRYTYTLAHTDTQGTRNYFTLYPRFKEHLGDVMDVLLGGVSPIVSVSANNSPYTQRLLIFGDRTMQSYLPFLLVHYEQITFVDTAQVTPELLHKIETARYNQILFAYSVDSFIGADQLSVISELPAPAS